jgi:hypothetical protein
VEAHLQFTTSAKEITVPLPVLVHAVSGDLERYCADLKLLYFHLYQQSLVGGFKHFFP